MPALELMGWNTTQRRWFKKYLGRMDSVSPKQLKPPATKEQSRTAANDWWDAKQKEVDTALGKAKQRPAYVVKLYEQAMKHHRVYTWWHRKYGDIEEATKSEAAVEWLQEALQSDDPPFPLGQWERDPAWEEKAAMNGAEPGQRPSGDGS